MSTWEERMAERHRPEPEPVDEGARQRITATFSTDARPAVRSLKSLDAAADAAADRLSGAGLTPEDIWLLGDGQ